MACLFEPLRIGNLSLKHRVVLAPLTRFRADDNHVPLDIAAEYYAQRASVSGGLLISEATIISPRAGGYPNVPGIYNQEQIKKWKSITDAVHAKGSYIFCQLWALGRAANPKVLAHDGYAFVSSSNIPLGNDGPAPEPLDEAGIETFTADYVQAAKNAIAAGFDGVEIHGANGYLLDQFLQDVCNTRTDGWGGSIENRSRFGVQVAKAVSDAIGPEKTGYRLSPWSTFQGMGMADPRPQFEHIVRQLKELRLAYVHLVESRANGDADKDGGPTPSNDFLIDAFGDAGAVILAGGFSPQSANEAVKAYKGHDQVAIAFGRNYISNPDLAFRAKNGLQLTPYNRETFYIPKSPVGYLDYPFHPEFVAQNGGQKSNIWT